MFRRVASVLVAVAVAWAGAMSPFAHVHAAAHSVALHDAAADAGGHRHDRAGTHDNRHQEGLHAHVRSSPDWQRGPDGVGDEAAVANSSRPLWVVETTAARECPQKPVGLDPMVAGSDVLPTPLAVSGSSLPATVPPPDPPPLVGGAPRGPPRL
ncbi:MAG: hypothetical protein O3A25_06360 [Acidobacteria bacterium]|nr:hypothetical protein [Acidobacteriota bacterium]